MGAPTRALLAICAGCALAIGVAQAATESEVKELIDRAETARQKASELEYEWRFTAKHIKEAKEHLEKGELDDAMRLAERALFEAEAAVEQHAISQQTWPLSVPR